MCLMTVRGEFLKETTIETKGKLFLFRNDEESFDVFEIKLITPKNRIFVLAQHYCDKKTAFEEYKEILKELRKP